MSGKNTNYFSSDSNSMRFLKSYTKENLENSRVIEYPFTEQHRYKSNYIKTSRYTILSWLPKSLFWQFRRVANIYFLIISVLTAMPFSPKNPYSMAMTFAGVLIFSILKEAYEDYFRHKQDNLENRVITHKFEKDSGSFVDIMSKKVAVGDLLQVKENEAIPADMVLISSSHSKGLAFVNTMNLDGESNLKEKAAPNSTLHLDTPEKLGSLKLGITCDKPNMSMVNWNCNIKLPQEQLPLDMKQLLMRGSLLKNTEYVYGVVIYTGHETKVMLNSKKAPSKMSNVLRMMNKVLYTVFGFQILICIAYAGLSMAWLSSTSPEHYYLELESSPGAGDFFVQILTYWVAYSHLIPISLYVALEVVKLAMAFLISSDLEMYYANEDKRANVRTSDLVEELGQVEFIFSDKTGTLTANEMVFKKCVILNEFYEFENKDSFEKLTQALKENNSSEKAQEFFLCLCLCNSVFITYEKNGKLTYQSTSPDELALIEASKLAGYVFSERSEGKVYLKDIQEETQEFEVLVEVPFTSDRKRMSVVVKHGEDVFLFTKGADSVMLDLLNEVYNIEEHLHELACEGLRTLVVASKRLDPAKFDEWLAEWNRIQIKNMPNKTELLEEHSAALETQLEYLGITAIEDKLQKGVPETIELLMESNIKLWVLTGDKEETAVEIGKSCKLIGENCEVLVLSSESEEELTKKLVEFEDRIGTQNKSVEELHRKSASQNVCVVIDGVALGWVLNGSEEIKDKFFKAGLVSNSCICCRVSPAQKMQVVKLAKQKGTWITLSIGDGANDVSMIQEAHIGVGVSGKEGTQALQASDFSIAQFRFLSQLLLVHGRWAYKRVSWFICYYFYKNIVIVSAELWFAWWNGFSGQIFFMDWLPMLYNAAWTSWPCMIAYLFEKDLTAEESLRNPQAYKAGQERAYFTFARFWVFVLLGIWHGAVCYWVPVLAFDGPLDTQAKDTGLWWISTLSFTLAIHIITLKLYLESIHWTKLSIGVGVLSVLVYYLSVLVLCTEFMSSVFQPEAYKLFSKVLDKGMSWIAILLVPVLALIPDFLLVAGEFVFCPTKIQQLLKKRGKNTICTE